MYVFYIHRVLNTDNMSIVGLTIDYGPYGFMDRYDPGHICNGSGLPNTCTVYLYTNSTPNMCNVCNFDLATQHSTYIVHSGGCQMCVSQAILL